jgi:hypothetical protein
MAPASAQTGPCLKQPRDATAGRFPHIPSPGSQKPKISHSAVKNAVFVRVFRVFRGLKNPRFSSFAVVQIPLFILFPLFPFPLLTILHSSTSVETAGRPRFVFSGSRQPQ